MAVSLTLSREDSRAAAGIAVGVEASRTRVALVIAAAFAAEAVAAGEAATRTAVAVKVLPTPTVLGNVERAAVAIVVAGVRAEAGVEAAAPSMLTATGSALGMSQTQTPALTAAAREEDTTLCLRVTTILVTGMAKLARRRLPMRLLRPRRESPSLVVARLSMTCPSAMCGPPARYTLLSSESSDGHTYCSLTLFCVWSSLGAGAQWSTGRCGR